MRDIHTSIEQRLLKRVQAGDNAVRADLWISRPTIPLTEDRFLERQVVPGVSASDVSVAVEHPKADSDASAVFIAYVENGTAKVKKAMYQTHMESHVWVDTGFSEPAEAVSICFDGTMPKSLGGRVEFVSESDPWVFWVSGGKLYTRKLNGAQTTTLADGNCTSVSAVRAVWSEVSKFNFGLVVFFLLGGYLYYRQRIDRAWTDAEMVSFGPAGVLWSDIAAFRTWDYRIGVQALSQDGYLYELFTQFMGIGTRSSEHLEIKGASSSDELTPISYSSFKTPAEHITIDDAFRSTLYGGCYEIGPVEAITVRNSKNASGDWGTLIELEFTKEINLHQIQEQEEAFTFTDSEGVLFYPSAISADYTGRVIRFEFISFNNAVGDITVGYTPGTVSSMYGEPLSQFELHFTPIGLVPVEGLPEAINAWNGAESGASISDGRYVYVQFSEPLHGELNDNLSKFSVLIEKHNFSEYPDGSLVLEEVPIYSMRWSTEQEAVLILELGAVSAENLQKCAGDVVVQYKGGTLYGEKGPMLSFKISFTPQGLSYRGDVSNSEHMTILGAEVADELLRVYYSSYKHGSEHLSIVTAYSNSVLTHIDDI